jgi:putative Mg2+ transporter-C (MgtC) family protein
MQVLLPPLDTKDLLVRLATATLAGAIVGLNRDLHHKPAGLRTHALVGLGASLLVSASMMLTPNNLAGIAPVIQGIMTGIGFLGAGVILHQGELVEVHGLTTAATIWVTAALGIGCGMGYWPAALGTVTILLLVLSLGGPIERNLHRWLARIFPDHPYRDE